MIRRDFHHAGQPAGWLLISQVEHARLAGELARQWGREPFSPLAGGDEALAAVFCHDDGWALWEREPKVDPATGRPLNFTEMPLDQSLEIWQCSIDVARQQGPLAAWMVSGHFSALLRHANSWQRAGHAADPAARAFLAEQDGDRHEWLTAWQGEGASERTAELAGRALEFLQFFDALSLWFCTAERTEPHSLPVPGGPMLKLVPRSPSEIVCEPWPLRCDRMELSAAGRLVPARHYLDADDLAAESGREVELSWELVPSR